MITISGIGSDLRGFCMRVLGLGTSRMCLGYEHMRKSFVSCWTSRTIYSRPSNSTCNCFCRTYQNVILTALVAHIECYNVTLFYARCVKISNVKTRYFHWRWISWIDSCAHVAYLAVSFSSWPQCACCWHRRSDRAVRYPWIICASTQTIAYHQMIWG